MTSLTLNSWSQYYSLTKPKVVYLIVFTAGHDTTRNAISAGMKALLENPDQMAKLLMSNSSCKGFYRSMKIDLVLSTLNN